MTVVLAFDSSGATLSAAVVTDRGDGPHVRARRAERLERGHAARLLPFLREVLASADCSLAAIDVLAVTVGPGSFTGVRIGLATARALAMATGKPLAGYSTLDVLLAQSIAAHGKPQAPLVAAIDTKRGDAYLALADSDRGPFLGTSATLASMLPTSGSRIVGDMGGQLQTELAARGIAAIADLQMVAPDPVSMARRALHDGAEHWAARNRLHGLPGPLYLRAADVTLPDGTRTHA